VSNWCFKLFQGSYNYFFKHFKLEQKALNSYIQYVLSISRQSNRIARGFAQA